MNTLNVNDMKNDVEKHRAASEIWMNYFNEYLFKNNIISERSMRKMRNLILTSVHRKN